jgi:hypothetical protein
LRRASGVVAGEAMAAGGIERRDILPSFGPIADALDDDWRGEREPVVGKVAVVADGATHDPHGSSTWAAKRRASALGPKRQDVRPRLPARTEREV